MYVGCRFTQLSQVLPLEVQATNEDCFLSLRAVVQFATTMYDVNHPSLSDLEATCMIHIVASAATNNQDLQDKGMVNQCLVLTF